MIRRIIIFFISFYQKILSPDTGVFKRTRLCVCVFYPTCSQYTKEAIEKYGVIKGCLKGFVRIARCNPWQKKHIDKP